MKEPSSPGDAHCSPPRTCGRTQRGRAGDGVGGTATEREWPRGDRCESWMLDTRGLIRPFCLLCILTFSRIKSLFLKKRKNYRCRCRRVSTAKITRRMKNSQAIRNSHRWTHPPNEANGESCGRFFYVFFLSSSFFFKFKIFRCPFRGFEGQPS